jgi:hypothetical protein
MTVPTVRIGWLICDADSPKNKKRAEGERVNVCRQASADVFWKVRVVDDTQRSFVFVDAEGKSLKEYQQNAAGVKYTNIQWGREEEYGRGAALAAYDLAERRHFEPWNRAGFIRQVQKSLHFWCKISSPYERVRDKDFVPVHIQNSGLRLTRVRRALIRIGEAESTAHLLWE